MLSAATAKHLALSVTGLVYESDDDEVPDTVFHEHMPSSPDTAVAVMSAGGRPQPTLGAHDFPSVQVLVRALDAQTGHDLAMAIYGELHGLDRSTLDDGGDDEVFVIGCTATQSAPIPLGKDANQRQEWSLNFDLTIDAPSTHRPGGT